MCQYENNYFLMSQNASSQIQILHKESALFSWETFPVKGQQIKFETLCKQAAAELICSTIFNAKLGQEALWLISSQLKTFQNSKTKACIGNMERDLIIMLKTCYSAAQDICTKGA